MKTARNAMQVIELYGFCEKKKSLVKEREREKRSGENVQ
jgi:hypothetical protein